MRFFRFFVLGCLLLSSCAKPQESLEELGPLSFRDAAVDLPFCWEQPHVLLNRLFKGQGLDYTYYKICISEQKAGLQIGTVSAGILVSYLQQEYYLEALDFEQFRAEVEAAALVDTHVEQDYSQFGTCNAQDTVTIQDSSIERFVRRAPCSWESDDPEWVTSVEGDFEGVVDAIEAQIPNLKGLIDLGQALPYPADALIYQEE